jgi:hypothetical protein
MTNRTELRSDRIKVPYAKASTSIKRIFQKSFQFVMVSGQIDADHHFFDCCLAVLFVPLHRGAVLSPLFANIFRGHKSPMHYQFFNIRNVNGQPFIELIEEDFAPPQGTWAGYEKWFQARIDELRQQGSYQQIVVWTTKPAAEGAIIALEYPANNQRGKLQMIVKD